MAAFRALVVSALAATGASIKLQGENVVHNLTVCNAYAESKPLSVYTLNNKAKLTEEPLPYKACKDIALGLEDGERVDFKLGGLSVGTFHATNLPFVASQLLLVPYKKGNGTMSATFYSHAFSSADEKAQLAVVDTLGNNAVFKITHGTARQAESADMKPGSIVSLQPGAYQIALEDGAGKKAKTATMLATNVSKHVYMRVGGTDGYPVELMAFPSEHSSHSGAASAGGLLAAVMAAFAAVFA